MLRLCDEHVQIRAVIDRITAIIKEPAPSDWGELAPLRLALSRSIKSHLENEDRFMGKAMWSHAGVPSDLLGKWALDRQAIRVAYSEHLRTWSLPAIGKHWDAYRKAFRELVKNAEALMRLEEAEIYRFAEKLSQSPR